MTPLPHRVPAEVFDAVAAGGGGARALGLLARAEYSRRLACAYAVTAGARELGGAAAEAAEEAWETLGAVRGTDPDAARAVLTHPSTGIALMDLLARTDRARAAGTGGAGLPVHRFTALAAAASVRAGLPVRLRWPLTDDGLFLPSLGRPRLWPARPGGTAHVEVTADGTARAGVRGPGTVPARTVVPRDPHRTTARWQGAHRLAVLDTGAALLLDDVDPLRFPGVREPLGLSTDDVRRWSRTAREAARLLRADHPRTYAELAAGTRTLVPLGGGGTTSGSSAEAFGCVALSRPSGAAGLALTLTHEMQHSKFAAVLHLFDLFDADAGELFYAPWRPDPRPVVGLFHGAYAHTGVASFWNRHRTTAPDPADRAVAQTQFARWRSAGREATRTLLASGRLTPLGERFAGRMLDTLDGLCRLPVPPEAARRARELAAAHRAEWTRRNGTPRPLSV
ncbi:HEXXH motif domain-containing protein [Streptomyces sp. NPDC090306]|uniref:HEXXH motif domain-containing protein n=1 Tax=Streptomyces sp. NPDC090306 TaxID=3365961 RepID=UPI0037F59687